MWSNKQPEIYRYKRQHTFVVLHGCESSCDFFIVWSHSGPLWVKQLLTRFCQSSILVFEMELSNTPLKIWWVRREGSQWGPFVLMSFYMNSQIRVKFKGKLRVILEVCETTLLLFMSLRYKLEVQLSLDFLKLGLSLKANWGSYWRCVKHPND